MPKHSPTLNIAHAIANYASATGSMATTAESLPGSSSTCSTPARRNPLSKAGLDGEPYHNDYTSRRNPDYAGWNAPVQSKDVRAITDESIASDDKVRHEKSWSLAQEAESILLDYDAMTPNLEWKLTALPEHYSKGIYEDEADVWHGETTSNVKEVWNEVINAVQAVPVAAVAGDADDDSVGDE